MSELETKLNHVKNLLAAHKLDALLLRKISSTAWITNGAPTYINSAAAEGVASALITPSGRFWFTTNIEAPHFEKEEFLKDQGWEFVINPWHGAEDMASRIKGLKLGSDSPFPGAADLSGEVSRLRANLTPEEQERFRHLGRDCAAAMQAAIHMVKPGMTEYEIAAALSHEAQRRGVQPIVNLVATDARIFMLRHPLPTGKTMQQYAMMVLCGRRHGLVISITRLVHFGKLSDELVRKSDAVARIDTTFITASRPGAKLGEVFAKGTAAYAATGYPEEWRLHHQGGPAGYEPREYLGLPGSKDVVVAGQAYAWNPSVTGTKSEDTVLITDTGFEVLTRIPAWPSMDVTVDGFTLSRPLTLVVE